MWRDSADVLMLERALAWPKWRVSLSTMKCLSVVLSMAGMGELEGNWRGNVRGGEGRGGEKGGRYLLIMLDAEIQEHGDDEGGVLVVPVVGEFFAG